jgi:protein-S-isoprenylcysteine O-methyltransferase Ste14
MKAAPRKMSPAAFAANVLATALFFPALILLLAGRWNWAEGWIFALWMAVMIEFILIYTYWKDPALLAERTRAGSGNQKPWDKVLMVLILLTAVAWLVVLPLDAGRFSWSPAFPLWLKIPGGALLVPALFFIERATIDNTFLSAQVRIQSDRKQHVVTGGVYGFVRHPLYLGVALLQVGAPLLVGSLYGLLLSGIGILLLVVRIVGEEKMLLEELEGYAEYKQQVKYRLIPFVW